MRVVPDWTLIAGRDDLDAFAGVLLADQSQSQSRTSISDALLYGWASLDANRFEGPRRVIDISGDGPNNLGGLVKRVRDQVFSAGIVINCLLLMTRDNGGARWRVILIFGTARRCGHSHPRRSNARPPGVNSAERPPLASFRRACQKTGHGQRNPYH